MKAPEAKSFAERIKGAFKRFGEQLSGEVEVEKKDEPTFENLEDRPHRHPAMDAYENSSEMLFRFDVPGATAKNTEVHFGADRVLTVYVRNEPDESGGAALLSEFEESDWYRAVTLAETADGDKATSTVKDGILTVRIPKYKVPAPKLIPVKVGR